MSGGTQMSQDSTIPEDAPAPIPEETNSAPNTTQTNMDAPRRPLDSRLVSFHDAAPEGLTGPDGNPPTLAALAVAETAVKVASTNHFTTTANSFENHSASNLGAANASDATTANSTAYSGAPDSAKASERARKPPDNEGLGGPDDDDDNENETINNKRKNKIVDKSPTGRYVRFNDLLGEGAFKKVYRAYDTTQGVEVAWNQVKVSRMSPAARQRVVQEMKILQELDHPSIIHFFSSFLNKDAEAVVFITEMMASGTLKEFIQNRPVLLRIVKRWCRHILHALIYLHDHDPPIIHRDLKCDNIFINGSTGDIRIGDLGLASWQRQGAARTVLGTPEYMAPEMFEELYDEQVDIYAFGMCVLEMITKETPFMECQSAPQIYKKVIAGITPACFDRVIEGPAKDFIFQCIKMRPAGERRPSAQELRKDPFLQKRDDPADDIDCQELLKSDVAPTDKRSDSLGSLPRGTAELPMPPTQEYSRSRSRRDSSPVHPRNTEEPPSSAGYGEEPRSTKSMMSAKSTGSPTETEEDRSETSGMKLSSVRESSNTHQKAPLSPKSDTEVHEFPMTASPNLGPSAVFDDNASVGAVSLPPPSTSPVPNGSSSVHSTDTAPPSSTVIPPNMMQDRTQGASMPPPAAPGTAKKTRVMIGRGISVEARFNGEGEWYPGKIQDLNNDSTIAIKYNDQRFEPRVSADLIRVRADDGRTFILADVLKQPRKTLDNGDIQPAENTVQALDGSHRKVMVVPVSPISPGEVMSPRTADQGHQSLGIGSRSTSTGTGFAGAPETTGNVVKNAPQQQQMAPPQQIQPPPPPQQQQQQQQQAPMLAPGRRTTPVPPSSQAQGSRPATAQSAKMQQPHSQQAPPGSADVPQQNNDPRSTLKRQVSTTSLTSQASSAYALGTYWRIICTGPMENQSSDQLNIRFTLRDTVTKTKQTAQFCYDLNSDEPGALATELIDEMRIAATEHDTIAQKFASFVQEYRRYRETPPSQPGSPKEPFRLAAEQKSLPAALAGMSAGVSGVSGIVNNPATLSPSMGPGTSQTPPLAQFQHPQQRQPTIPGQPQQQQQQYQQQQTPMAQQAPQQAQQQYQQQLPKAQQQQQLPRPPMPSGEFEGTDIFLGMPPAVFGESQQDLAAFDRLLDEEKVRYEEFHAEYKRKIDEINKLREMAQRQTQTVQSGQANGVNGGGGYVSNTPEGNLPHVENSDNMAEPEAASVGVMPPPPTRQILFHPNELALVSADTDLIDPDPDDQSEEARQWRRLLAEHRQRQKKEMIKLQKAREAAAAEKKLFDVDNLSLSEDGNKSKTNTSLKEQMRQRSLAGYPRLSSEGSNSSFTLNAAGPGAAVPPTAAAINHGSTSGMVIAGMLGQSVTSQQQPPLMVSATTTTQPYFLGDSSAVQGFVQTSSQPFQEPLTASHMPALHNQIQGQPQLSQPPQQQSLNQVPQAAPAAPQQPQQQQQQQQPQQQQQQQPQQPQQQQQQQQQPQQPQPTQPQHAQQPQGQLGQPQIVPPSQVASVHPSTVPASQQ